MSDHQWGIQNDFCQRCGAARAEVEDGVRVECLQITDGDGNPKPLRTYGMPGGEAVARLLSVKD